MRNLITIEQYKKDQELLSFIHVADVSEEEEIYKASPSTSMIFILRPPFYKLFELSDEQIKSLYELYNIEQWSLALFNVERDKRLRVEQYFSEKEKLLYMHRLKTYDRLRPDLELIGQVRDKIGRSVQQLQANEEHATERDVETDERLAS